MRTALAILLFLFAGCSTLPTPELQRFNNDCFPQAVAMVQGLRKYDIPAQVLVLQPYDRANTGHAIAVYRYRGKHYAWDQIIGTVEVRAPWVAYLLGYNWFHQWGYRFNALAGFSGAYFAEDDSL